MVIIFYNTINQPGKNYLTVNYSFICLKCCYESGDTVNVIER